MIPVHGESDDVFAVLRHVKAAKQEGVSNQSSAKLVGEAEVGDARALLDVRDANYYLEQAASSLKHEDIHRADNALATLQNNVIHEFREVDVPLLRARRSLKEAARMAVYRDYRGAKGSIQQAADQLRVYKSEVGKATAKTTQAVTDDIRKVSNRLQEDKEVSAQRITGIWDKLARSF